MAFVAGPALPAARNACASAVCNKNVRMSAAPEISRRAALSVALSAAAAAALPRVAGANIEYPNVGFLGGGDKLDVVCRFSKSSRICLLLRLVFVITV
jgi:hypothetical protein